VVKLHPYNIGQKVAIIVEHFRANVAPLLGGRAKAMVVTDSRKSAVRYKLAMDKYLSEHHIADIRTLVAFSGEVTDPESGPLGFTEASMNERLKGRTIPEALAGPDFEVLIVANKYQTGFDQPLLCAMYVDKRLDGVQAVQTLSRLNRIHPGKRTYVLDFVNQAEDVLAAFLEYYEGAHLTEASDPNLVFDQWDKLEAVGVFSDVDVQATAQAYFGSGESKPLQGSSPRRCHRYATGSTPLTRGPLPMPIPVNSTVWTPSAATSGPSSTPTTSSPPSSTTRTPSWRSEPCSPGCWPRCSRTRSATSRRSTCPT